MIVRYSNEIKTEALHRLGLNGGSISRTSIETGIPPSTLRGWRDRHRKNRLERLLVKVEQLHEQLLQNTLFLAKALQDRIEDAPLNQLSSALGTSIDRYLKIDEYLKQQFPEEAQEETIRFEYVYPDQTVHDAPPWAAPDYAFSPSVSGRGVRAPLRQDVGRAATYFNGGAEGQDLLVARADLPDGEPGVARFEDDLSAFSRYSDERDRAPD